MTKILGSASANQQLFVQTSHIFEHVCAHCVARKRVWGRSCPACDDRAGDIGGVPYTVACVSSDCNRAAEGRDVRRRRVRAVLCARSYFTCARGRAVARAMRVCVCAGRSHAMRDALRVRANVRVWRFWRARCRRVHRCKLTRKAAMSRACATIHGLSDILSKQAVLSLHSRTSVGSNRLTVGRESAAAGADSRT